MRRPLPLLLAILVVAPLAAAQSANPEDPANLSWVEKGVLAIGGGGLEPDNVSWLHANGFGAVADFRSEHADPADAIAAAGMDYLYIPIEHGQDIDPTQLDQFIAWADAEAAAGKIMYIHCTNGWHRAGAFAVAWRMHREHASFDRAAQEQIALRPGTVMRAPGAMLHWQAAHAGAKPLDVVLESPQARPPQGGSMPITVETLSAGAPVAGASVHLWSESGRVDATATSGADGKATFDFPAPAAGTFTDFVYARASAQGFADGADQTEIFYGIDVPGAGTLGVSASAAADGIHVHVARQGPLHARVIAWTADGWSAYRSTPTGDVTLPTPPQGGAVTIRVESWGGTGASTTITLPGGAPSPKPAPSPAPAPAPTPKPVASPAATPAMTMPHHEEIGSSSSASAPPPVANEQAPSSQAASASGPSGWIILALASAALAALAGIFVILRIIARGATARQKTLE